MTQVEANQVNHDSELLVNTLCQHEFVVLPTRGNGSYIAVRTYQNHGAVCCDILVFRLVKETGIALRREVTLLIQTLKHLQSQLPDSPHHLNSNFQSHAISFLGKKAHVLTYSTTQPLYCQMVPLILYQTDDFLSSIRDHVTAYPAQVMHTNNLDEFLTQNLPQRTFSSDTQSPNVQELKKSYQKLGLSLIMFPLFLGLSGILASLGLFPIALITLTLGIVGPIILLHRATKLFEHFRIKNMIPVQAAQPLETSTLQNHQDEIQSETLPSLVPSSSPTSTPDKANTELAIFPPHRRRKQKSEVFNK
ncbi:MAG: hypothetical protein ACFFBR_00330 [Promethearchaeota archaeon]